MGRRPAHIVLEKVVKTVKRLPASECGSAAYCTSKNGKKYIVSQNPSKERLRFTLWKYVDDGLAKLACADSPYDLYPLINWQE